MGVREEHQKTRVEGTAEIDNSDDTGLLKQGLMEGTKAAAGQGEAATTGEGAACIIFNRSQLEARWKSHL